jgi:hypothetical protein
MAPSLIDELLALFPGYLTFGWAVAEIFLTLQRHHFWLWVWLKPTENHPRSNNELRKNHDNDL